MSNKNNFSITLPIDDYFSLEFDYTNHRNEVSHRKAELLAISFGSTEYHPESQWILTAHDFTKDAPRDFAMKDMTNIKKA